MANLSEAICSVGDFKRDSARALEHVRSTGRPLVLTVNGKAELVVQDPASYQTLLELADRMEGLLAVKRGAQDLKAGRTKLLKDVLENLGKKNGYVVRAEGHRGGGAKARRGRAN